MIQPTENEIKTTIDVIIRQIGHTNILKDAVACACIDYWSAHGIDLQPQKVAYVTVQHYPGHRELLGANVDVWSAVFVKHYLALEAQYGA